MGKNIRKDKLNYFNFFDIIKKKYKIKNDNQLSINIGLARSYICECKKGKSHLTLQFFIYLCQKYKIDFKKAIQSLIEK